MDGSPGQGGITDLAQLNRDPLVVGDMQGEVLGRSLLALACSGLRAPDWDMVTTKVIVGCGAKIGVDS